MEEWKEVPDTEGCYQISNLGRLRRMHRQAWRKPFTIAQGFIAGNGYWHHSISSNGKAGTIYPHQAVAKLFVKGFKKGLQVNHKDGNKLNNRWDNLEWVTRSQNMKHAYANGLSPVGINHHKSKLNPEKVLEIRERWNKNPHDQRALAKEYGVHQRTIWQVIHRIVWNHV